MAKQNKSKGSKSDAATVARRGCDDARSADSRSGREQESPSKAFAVPAGVTDVTDIDPTALPSARSPRPTQRRPWSS